LVDSALHTQDLRQKLNFASQAAALDPQNPDPLIVRGQTYLRLVSLAYSNKSKPSSYSRYIDDARMDFDRAVAINPKNAWAWLGKGDVQTWLKHPEDAALAYEQALELNPFFDVARQRRIVLYTTEARKLALAKQWSAAQAMLTKLLEPTVAESWVPYQKEAYLLRSEVRRKLNRPTEAIADLSTVLQVDPTNVQALLARARLYRTQMQGRMAKDDFERACVLGASEACKQLP
jgi:tetratricopeptide (TPR) repeat protein